MIILPLTAYALYCINIIRQGKSLSIMALYCFSYYLEAPIDRSWLLKRLPTSPTRSVVILILARAFWFVKLGCQALRMLGIRC